MIAVLSDLIFIPLIRACLFTMIQRLFNTNISEQRDTIFIFDSENENLMVC
jgi:hypothetical protein